MSTCEEGACVDGRWFYSNVNTWRHKIKESGRTRSVTQNSRAKKDAIRAWTIQQTANTLYYAKTHPWTFSSLMHHTRIRFSFGHSAHSLFIHALHQQRFTKYSCKSLLTHFHASVFGKSAVYLVHAIQWLSCMLYASSEYLSNSLTKTLSLHSLNIVKRAHEKPH